MLVLGCMIGALVILPEMCRGVGQASHIGLLNCFHAGFWAFSELKYTVKGVTNSCNLRVIIKLNTYLIFISGVVVHFVCHY